MVWGGGGGVGYEILFVPEVRGKYMGKNCCIYVGLVRGW